MIDRPRPAGETPPTDPEVSPARSELADLLERELEVEAILGEKRVPLCDLSGSEVGDDLMLLPRGKPVRLVVGSVEIGEGTTVEVDGRLALRIDRLRSIEELAAELGGWLRAEGAGAAPPVGENAAGPTSGVPLQKRSDRG